MERSTSLGFDPTEVLVGEISTADLDLEDGWNPAAADRDSEIHLWAGAAGGNVLCFRAVSEGRVLPTLSIYRPDPEVTPPAAGPTGPPPGGCPNGPLSADDGGGKDCAYVCAPTGDGGYICWKVCN
jgi:hypothetical protein